MTDRFDPLAQCVVVSECPVTRVGLSCLAERAGLAVACEALSLEVQRIRLLSPGCVIVLLDLSATALEAAECICRSVAGFVRCRVVGVRFGCGPTVGVRRLVAAGMFSYVAVGPDAGPLIHAIRAAAQGERVVHLRPGMRDIELVDSDLDIVRALTSLATDRDVGSELGLGASTVRHHIESVRAKALVQSRFQLGVWVRHANIVSSAPSPTDAPPSPGSAPRSDGFVL